MTSPVKTYPLHAAFEDDALRIGELDDYAALLAQHEVAMAELNDANMALELLHEDYEALMRRVAEVGEARSERDRMFLSAREWAGRFGQMEARADRLAEAGKLIVDGAIPATTSGHTCFVPRYQIDQLKAALDVRILAEPGEVGS